MSVSSRPLPTVSAILPNTYVHSFSSFHIGHTKATVSEYSPSRANEPTPTDPRPPRARNTGRPAPWPDADAGLETAQRVCGCQWNTRARDSDCGRRRGRVLCAIGRVTGTSCPFFLFCCYFPSAIESVYPIDSQTDMHTHKQKRHDIRTNKSKTPSCSTVHGQPPTAAWSMP